MVTGYSGFHPYQNPFASNDTKPQLTDQMYADWANRLRTLQDVSQPTRKIDAPVSPIQLSETGPRPMDSTSGIQTVQQSAGTPGQGFQAAALTSPQAGESGAGMISDNYNPLPGRYYSDVPYDKSGSLINDPSQAIGFWSKFHGFSPAYADRLSSVFNITDLLRAMGIGGTQMQGTNLLDWEGRLADRLSGRVQDAAGGGYDYLNAPSIVANIFNTPRAGLGTGANQLSTAINNPNLQPEDQIKNLVQFTLGSMQGVLTSQQLDAYSQVLDQLATAYMQQYNTQVGSSVDSPTFLEFVRQYGGQYGGMF